MGAMVVFFLASAVQ